ncbi:hypothetical protein C7E13_17505 [Stenotrophomonas maltophilia]|nr:hypothetical protein C7E13_17505 [Stenotrophomonas maltophilia]
MDQYFQREGRDWERYAWLKARAVAGDIEAGEAWLQTLRPFVYRRYLDFTALDGLREMKAAITAEVARRELHEDIKRGAGGIREIEFLCQALQLIRGGREPALRERRLLVALDALVAAGQIAPGDAVRCARPTCSCAAWRTACRCCAMRRPTCCPAMHWTASASPSASATPTGTCCARRWPNSSSGSVPNSPRCWHRARARPRPTRWPITGVACPRAATRRCWPKPVSSMPMAPTSHCVTSRRAPA